MTIDCGDILTLDGVDEYVVVSKVTYSDDDYVFLNNVYDNLKVKVCVLLEKELNIKAIEVVDEKLLKKIMPLMLNGMKEALKDWK